MDTRNISTDKDQLFIICFEDPALLRDRKKKLLALSCLLCFTGGRLPNGVKKQYVWVRCALFQITARKLRDIPFFLD
jgi:hypothetical protein